MKRNMGSIDRTIRIIVGLVIIAVGLYYRSWWGLIGLLPLFIGTWGYCPLFTLFGIDSLGKKNK